MADAADHDYLAREARARKEIDRQLGLAGWVVQNVDKVNLSAGRGVAIREVVLEQNHGRVDYLLFVDKTPAGVIEAKPEGTTLVEVEHQSGKYIDGLPNWIKVPDLYPLPFIYESTGKETRFTNGYDPDARSRPVFSFHRPETLAEWSRQIAVEPSRATLRKRLQAMPELDRRGLWEKQATAIEHLESSLYLDRPRAVIQMATGSGKTFTAANISYRLIRHADAKRILFLVDRRNLGKQAKQEFDQFTIAETNRKFSSEYNIQHLVSNTVDDTARVSISTIQRVYSILSGKAIDDEADEESAGELPVDKPVDVEYSEALPPESFDFIVIDECHRSIYGLWRQVLEYFDAHLIGLTATPTKQTFGFFRQNLVMSYSHDMAVADKVNVDYTVYKIETAITQAGGTIDAGLFAGFRNRETRKVRWNAVDEALPYSPKQLDRAVVAQDQIRTVIKTFREKLFTEIFPGRSTVPKTLIFAKDDSHADDIIQVVREEFGKGNEFATKITYRTHDGKPDDLLQTFRNSLNPRIVVTVDMIATGTDVKPLECLLFMRTVKSRTYFEQMIGRGVRVINDTDFQSVTDDAKTKDRFVVVDAVGVMDTPLVETLQPLERKPTTSMQNLMKAVGFGSTDPEVASTLAGRLSRLDTRLTQDDRQRLTDVAGGVDISTIAQGIVEALDPDHQTATAVQGGASPDDEAAVVAAGQALVEAALEPLAANPELRNAIVEVRRSYEQTIDETSVDDVLFAGYSQEARDKASALVTSFKDFLEQNRDQIKALEVLYSRPYKERLTFDEVKDLAQAIQRPPHQWTPERLWRAYELLDDSKVRGSGGKMLTDIVSLVRFALEQDNELVPFKEQVDARFEGWLAAQQQGSGAFTNEQLRWLNWMKESIATEMSIEAESFEFTPFAEHGGIGRASQVFGDRLSPLMDELTQVLAA